MTLSILGKRTSQVEVTNIDQFGFWILVQEKEYFLPYTDFPWFKNAKINDIFNVQLPSPDHLYWPSLDIDLSLESLTHPELYPLTYK